MDTLLPRPSISVGKLSLNDLRPLLDLDEREVADYPWLQVQDIPLSESEQQQLDWVKSRLVDEQTHLLNEATIWGRAIYPLLLLAERRNIRAWAEVPLSTAFPNFDIAGIIDGVLGKSVAGRLTSPYLVVVEAKRGIEGADPIPQLYGQLLIAAHLNWQTNALEPQEIFGCFTIADNWTFLRAELSAIASSKPRLLLEFSREFSEKYEPYVILKILKRIVESHLTYG
jgi:hypothetical protein